MAGVSSGQLEEHLLEHPVAFDPDLVGPVGLHGGDRPLGHGVDLVAGRSASHEAGPFVGRIGTAEDPPSVLHLGEALAHGLFGDPQGLGHLRRSSAVGREHAQESAEAAAHAVDREVEVRQDVANCTSVEAVEAGEDMVGEGDFVNHVD